MHRVITTLKDKIDDFFCFYWVTFFFSDHVQEEVYGLLWAELREDKRRNQLIFVDRPQLVSRDYKYLELFARVSENAQQTTKFFARLIDKHLCVVEHKQESSVFALVEILLFFELVLARHLVVEETDHEVGDDVVITIVCQFKFLLWREVEKLDWTIKES